MIKTTSRSFWRKPWWTLSSESHKIFGSDLSGNEHLKSYQNNLIVENKRKTLWIFVRSLQKGNCCEIWTRIGEIVEVIL